MKWLIAKLRGLERREKWRLAWDLFMVWVALINLWMILFDLTYLWLRPIYFHYVPVITRIYDPVKGIEPHPLTEQFLETIDATRQLLLGKPAPRELERQVQKLRELSFRIVEENPFQRSGRKGTYEVLLEATARQAGTTADALRNPRQLEHAVQVLWPDDPGALRYRLDHLDPSILRSLKSNYYRTRDRWGRPTDRFWMLDLPFLLVFWLEFLVRWALALRRRTYARWFFFPIFNWYDVLGLLPSDYFRPFRLLRLVSVYMRLRRSELSNIGKDYFSRTVAYFSNILTEEVSDRVALRILSELEEEIQDGTHVHIVRATVEPRRPDIERVIVDEIVAVVTDGETMARLRELLHLNLENAVKDSERLRTVPIPNAVLQPLITVVGEIVVDASVESMVSTLASEDGKLALQEIVGSVLGEVFYGPAVTEIERLAKGITLEVISHMKDVVAVKKWALPDQDKPRPPMPWETTVEEPSATTPDEEHHPDVAT
ncbi:MAG TPA: hypothetical protein ENK19_05320 [Acidobacteria bacterium]|nr:hypothetical protein [Acidobacteriota bacterium]